MLIMIALVKPILFAFLKGRAVRQLVVELLEAYAKSTDNSIDDAAVALVKANIFGIAAPAPEPEAPAAE